MKHELDEFIASLAYVKTREYEYKRLGARSLQRRMGSNTTIKRKVIKAKRRNQNKGRKANRRKK